MTTSLICKYQVRPLPYLLGNAPTIGQGLYVLGFFVLNLILTAVNYEVKSPHAWYPTRGKQVAADVFWRTGVFAFVLLPLLILFSSRNNILLWLTNWSHTTFLLLHRWIARFFALYVLLHTFLALPLYYKEENKKAYWIWGAVATIAVVILVTASGLYVRRFVYESFLIMHVLLSVFVIVGCWYHIKYWIGLTWGYETWLYAAIAVWFFDRAARLARILTNGIHRAHITDLGEGYVRIDIAGIRWGPEPGKHVYVYFPTLNRWRPWENHPFSILPTTILQPSHRSLCSDSSDQGDVEKHNTFTSRVQALDRPTVGLTLFVKKTTGMLKSSKYLEANNSLLTLLEGPYPTNSTKEVLRCDRLLLIGGGIGITGLIPWVANHWNVKLAWSVKETGTCLVNAMEGVLSGVADKEVKIGSRLYVSELLAEEEAAGWKKIGIVVCGPGELCDDVRAKVSALGKQTKTVYELEVEAYSW